LYFAITHPGNSKVTAIGLFQLVWHVWKLFGIFWIDVQFGILVHLDLATWYWF